MLFRSGILVFTAVALTACASKPAPRATPAASSLEQNRTEIYRRDMEGAVASLPSPDLTRGIDPLAAADWDAANLRDACSSVRAPHDGGYPNATLVAALTAPSFDAPASACVLRLSTEDDAVFSRYDVLREGAALARRFNIPAREGMATVLRTPFLSYSAGNGRLTDLGAVRVRGAARPDGVGWRMTIDKELPSGLTINTAREAVAAFDIVAEDGGRDRIHLFSIDTNTSLTDSDGPPGGWELYLESAHAVIDSGVFTSDIAVDADLSPRAQAMLRRINTAISDAMRSIGGAIRQPQTTFIAVVSDDGQIHRFEAAQFAALNTEIDRLRESVRPRRAR